MAQRKCDCARCRGVVSADPVYGYDRAAVPSAKCLMCDQPIGGEAWHEYPVWARFGQMFFIHDRCGVGHGA